MKIHIVKKGETLEEIATRYKIDLAELRAMNTQIQDPENLLPGMKIRIPTKTSTVKKAVEMRQENDEEVVQEKAKEADSTRQTFKPFTPPVFPGGGIFPQPPKQFGQQGGLFHQQIKPSLPQDGLPDLSSKQTDYEKISGNEDAMSTPQAQPPFAKQPAFAKPMGIPPYQMPAVMPHPFQGPYLTQPHFAPYPAFPGPVFPLQPGPYPLTDTSQKSAYSGADSSESSSDQQNQYDHYTDDTGKSDELEQVDDDNKPLTPVQGVDDIIHWGQQEPYSFQYPYGVPGMGGPFPMPFQQDPFSQMGTAMPWGHMGMMPNVDQSQKGSQHPHMPHHAPGYGMMLNWNVVTPWTMTFGQPPQPMGQPAPMGTPPYTQQQMPLNMQQIKDCGCGGMQPMMPFGQQPFYPFPYPSWPMNVQGQWPPYGNFGPQQARFADLENVDFAPTENNSPFGEFPAPSNYDDEDHEDESR